MRKKPYVVAIGAVSGGGKTAVTRALEKCLPNARSLYFDDRDYDTDSGIEDICRWTEEGADVSCFRLESLAGDLERLMLEQPEFILMDYPFGYQHPLISGYIDYVVFIDTPLDIALARRMLRDRSKDTAFSILNDMALYLKKGRNAYLRGAEIARSGADLIVDGAQDVERITEAIRKALIKE